MARKEYMLKAEQVMKEVIIAYYDEHGKMPSSMSVLKSAMTRAYNAANADINSTISKKINYNWRSGISLSDHPDYPQAMADMISKYKLDTTS